jgi:RING finger protein 113A
MRNEKREKRGERKRRKREENVDLEETSLYTNCSLSANLENHEVQPEPEEEMPFACHICRQPFTDPIVTKCGHYFCERCAFDHHKKSKKCAICDAQTGGVFNEATKLITFLKKHAEKEKEKAKEEAEKEKSAATS